MHSFSRRLLARYAVSEMLSGTSASTLSKRLAAALIVSRHPGDADLLLADIDQELEDRGLLARASVTSASALNAQLKIRLAKSIEKAAKVEKAILVEQVDKEVIGGVRIETANHSWDKTIARKLSEIKGGI